ncbi:DivIVA domain-containing protein [Nocardioides sp. zg-DK7169]|uniref:DivIVA domain-containing protein n=1 Tax=Nocardioides sp. zg-DK7169 TaxID=2736600 RepID=UPI0015531F4E|nr:DivIVA domain-containing protein [Nocardioides sp. zg-DK7169]NPC95856.1 DivIVA domain-containing protein [Nocardioides sp. zg-DK7169]
MWFFAILVVLVMGAVAVVASGRGTPMAVEHDDRPDVLVPAEGPVRAEDLRRVRFSLAFRGYRMSEVDALLDRLAGQLDEHPAEETAEPPAEGPAAPYDGHSRATPGAPVPPSPVPRTLSTGTPSDGDAQTP